MGGWIDAMDGKGVTGSGSGSVEIYSTKDIITCITLNQWSLLLYTHPSSHLTGNPEPF